MLAWVQLMYVLLYPFLELQWMIVLNIQMSKAPEIDTSINRSQKANQVEPFEEWELTWIPLVDSIVVFIDGVPDPEWTYDAATNSVLFTVIPPGGSLVEIGYIIDPSFVDTGDTGDDDDSGDTGS